MLRFLRIATEKPTMTSVSSTEYEMHATIDGTALAASLTIHASYTAHPMSTKPASAVSRAAYADARCMQQ